MRTPFFDFIEANRKLFVPVFAVLVGIEIAILIAFGIYSIDERHTIIKNSRGEEVYKARGQLVDGTLQRVLLSLNTQRVKSNPFSVSYDRKKATTTIENTKGDILYQCEGEKTEKDMRRVLDGLVEKGIIGKGYTVTPNKDKKLVIVNTKGETIFEPDSQATEGELQKVLNLLKGKEDFGREYKIIYTDDSYATIISDANSKIIYTEEGHLVGGALNRVKNALALQLLKDEYDIEYFINEISFPVRSWIAFSIDFPLGIVLFFAFIVKLFYKEDDEQENKQENEQPERGDTFDKAIGGSKFMYTINTFSRFNVLAMGTAIFVIVFLYWTIPDTLLYLGEKGYKFLAEHKWIVLAIVVISVCLYVWRANRRDKFNIEKMKCVKEIQIEANRETIRAQTQLALKGFSSAKQIEE